LHGDAIKERSIMTSRKTSQLNEKRTKHSGFTLIELIMVIVILGILSAFALPKFADLSGSAEDSTIEGSRAAIRSAAAIVHAQFLARGSTDTSLNLEGTTIAIEEGYPDAETIDDAADIVVGDFSITLLTGDASVMIAGPSAENGDPCVKYTEATSSSAPVITAVLTVNDADGTLTAADDCD
jgi:MSHA pilin protein MshA